jgi:hypothetical protein
MPGYMLELVSSPQLVLTTMSEATPELMVEHQLFQVNVNDVG